MRQHSMCIDPPSPRPAPPGAGDNSAASLQNWRDRGAFHERPESPQGFGVRWLAGNGADTALEFMARVQSKAVCALVPRPPHSKTLARDAVHGPDVRPTLEVETPHEPLSQSGAEDARTPDASRVRGAQGTRVSVWSACDFSAALHRTVFQRAVQEFNARSLPANSLPGGEGRGEGERFTILAGSFCVMCLLLLAGCATKSPPTRAEIHQQSGSLTNLVLTNAWKAAPVSTNALRDNWLATFGDAQLDALVAEAMTNNLDLRVASTKVEQAAEYVELAKAALRPAVNLIGTGGLNMGGGDVSSALQGISLGASWEPDLWGRMRYGRNAAQATYASAHADFEFARQSLAASTAKSWFAASETWQQQQIAEAMVKSAQELVMLAAQRQKVGPGSEQDVALARASLGNYQDSARQVRLAHQQTQRALELLLGRYPGAELAARHDLSKLPGDIPAGLPIEMLERRPDMVAAERRVAAAFNRVGEARAAQLPRIILNANIAAIESDILQLKDDFENPTGGVGANLIAPIYKGGALKTQVRIRTLEQKEAVASYARQALRALGDVEDALGAGQTLAEREKVLVQVLTDNERALALAQTSYRVGSGDLRAVQQQQLSVHAARLALLRVQSEQLAQRVNLHLALGGSFQPSGTPQVSAVSN